MQTVLKSIIAILDDISAFSGSRYQTPGDFPVGPETRNESYLQILGLNGKIIRQFIF